jgi:hypothetical protein
MVVLQQLLFNPVGGSISGAVSVTTAAVVHVVFHAAAGADFLACLFYRARERIWDYLFKSIYFSLTFPLSYSSFSNRCCRFCRSSCHSHCC